MRRLCVLGNWFAGLSIEDCVDRSRCEWERVASGIGVFERFRPICCHAARDRQAPEKPTSPVPRGAG